LDEIGARRGQTLAQMALVWVLRDPRVASTLIGGSSVLQLAENLAALERLAASLSVQRPSRSATES
jgi:L-glyceraldehyde 3-phosphate reductase